MSAEENNTYEKVLASCNFVTPINDVELTDGLISGIIPSAIVVACTDMETPLPYVCSDPSVELFTFQNLGHKVVEKDLLSLLSDKKIPHLIVYGHTDCRFTKFLSIPQNVPATQDIILSNNHFKSESICFMRHYQEISHKDSSQTWVEMNHWSILREIAGLASNIVIRRCIESNGLKVHGWCHDSARNTLQVFDPSKQEFVAQAIFHQ